MALGGNYYDACAQPEAGAAAAACLEGMRRVMRGELSHFLHDYACGPTGAEHWFRIHVVPVGVALGAIAGGRPRDRAL